MALEYERERTKLQAVRDYGLSLIPIVRWLPKYTLSKARNDFIAGLTVGLMVVPQALAYANIAGLDQQYGLYSAFMGCFMYVLLGTAKDVTLGPTAIMSLLTASNSDQVDGKTLPAHAIFLTFMAGVIQLGMGLLRLGFIVDFISFPVISGFTSAAAITIGFGQVKHIFGLRGVRRPFTECVYDTFRKLNHTVVPDLILGLICVIALYLLKRVKRRYDNPKSVLGSILWFIGTARNAIVVILAGIFAYAMLKTGGIDACSSKHFERMCMTVVGDLPPHLPTPELPDLSKTMLQDPKLVKGMIVIALIGYLESIAIGKAFARQNNYKIDQSQELVAIGAANIVSSFVRSYPATGSFSRTAVNSASGVETPMGGIITGTIVILALQFLTSLFKYIPQAALASIIISSVVTMIDYKVVRSIFKVSKMDLLPYAISFFGTLFLGIEDGVGIAVGVNVLYLLYIAARPGNTLLAYEEGRVSPRKFSPTLIKTMPGGVMVLQLGGSLMFPSVEHIKDMVLELQRETRCPAIVVDFTKVSFVDYTGAHGLQDVLRELEEEEVRLLLASVTPRVHAVLLRMDIEAAATIYDSVVDALIVAQSRDGQPEDDQISASDSTHLLATYPDTYSSIPVN